MEYQLFQMAKKLTSNDLVVLKATYEMEKPTDTPTNENYDEWTRKISQSMGHSISALVDLADRNLEENGFFKRVNRNTTGVITPRMTDLGNRLCHHIKWYHIEKNRMKAGWE